MAVFVSIRVHSWWSYPWRDEPLYFLSPERMDVDGYFPWRSVHVVGPSNCDQGSQADSHRGGATVSQAIHPGTNQYDGVRTVHNPAFDSRHHEHSWKRIADHFCP